MGIPRAVLYARSSAEDRGAAAVSVEEQLSRLRAFCQREGMAVVAEYSDVGNRGIDIDRAGLRQLVVDAENGGVDVVVTGSFDRLARDSFTLNLLLDHLHARGIGILSASDPDLLSVHRDKAFEVMRAAFAEYEAKETDHA